ncbi:MAG: hypothetical protein M5R36_14860 [Deltaproteobacteria bacterium]|nr:hypothetical protein [Deltaproteobacteria bacterium]
MLNRRMPSVRARRLRALLPVFLIALAASCAEPARPVAFAEFENLRKIDLTPAARAHVLEIGKGVATGRSYEKRAAALPAIYEPAARGVFLSVMRPGRRALTAFGFENSIELATVRAATLLRRMAGNEDLSALRLRADVMLSSSDRVRQEIKRSWRFDTAHNGIAFNTDPPIAILPQEIQGYYVINERGKFYYSGIKQLILERMLGRVVRDQFKETDIEIVLFDVDSFMEEEGGGVRRMIGMSEYDVPITEAAIRSSILAGADYLVRNIDLETGKFNYRYYPSRNFDSASYNLLRHAGTVYALGEVYELTHDAKLLQAMEAGLKFIEERLDGPKEADKAAGADFLAFADREDKEAKTGGAALALLAMAKHAEVTGDRGRLPAMRALARFLVFNIGENGKLESKYYYDEKAHKPFDSNYYPGEAALALVRLHSLDGDKQWVEAARKIADYLRTVRDADANVYNVVHDQWLSVAMSELYPLFNDPVYKDHVYLIGDAMVRRQVTDNAPADILGGFSSRPASTPTATRNEALVALFQLARREGDNERAEKYWKASILAAGLQLRMQFNELNSIFSCCPTRRSADLWKATGRRKFRSITFSIISARSSAYGRK